MTEYEPIIIAGVDISGCEYYQYNMCTATKDNYGDCSYYCKDYDMKDCYFKQLVRKTQECEYWKHQAELGSDTTDRLAKQLEEKEQECEIWKNQVLTIDDEAVTVEITQQQFEEYNQLKQKEREGKL